MKHRILFAIVMVTFSSVALAQDGAPIYKAKCAICHGADGMGKVKLGPKLVGTTKTEDQIVNELTKGGAAKGKHVKPMDGMTSVQAKAVAGFVKNMK